MTLLPMSDPGATVLAVKRLLLALPVVLALSACGSGSSSDAAAAPSPAKSPKASRCLPVDPEVLERIAGGAQDGVGVLTFTKAAAVKSKDFSSVYMVAGKFNAPGVKDKVGVWALNSLTPGESLTLSVDGFAQEFTNYPDASKTKAGIKQSDDGVDAARDCVK